MKFFRTTGARNHSTGFQTRCIRYDVGSVTNLDTFFHIPINRSDKPASSNGTKNCACISVDVRSDSTLISRGSGKS